MSDRAASSSKRPADSIFPETAPLIHHARSTSVEPYEKRIAGIGSIGALLALRASESPDKPWLTFYTEEGRQQEWTRGQFDLSVRRLAAYLSVGLGLRPGDRIATLAVNDPLAVVTYFAAWTVGLTVVPVNCGEEDDRVQYIIQNSEARAVFAQTAQIGRVDSLLSGLSALRHKIELGDSGRPSWLPFAAAESFCAPLDTPADIAPDTECLIVYTSGTTGPPKGVVLEQANLLIDAESIASWHRFGPEDRAMCVLPIHHVNGTVVTLVTPLYSGGTVVLNRRFSAQAFWNIVEAERCTWSSVVPTVLAFLCEQGDDISRRNLSKFRHIVCGAGPLTVEVARRFDQAFGIRVVHGYGLSETTCYSCFLPVDLPRDAYTHWMFECGFPSIGCPVSANEMAIHDAGGGSLPPDTRGEIVIRGQNVMRYYFQRPDANRDTFEHGWFRSGDEGFRREGEDGRDYYFITGRIKELIIRGGVNYSPFDIDEVLCRVPGVKAAMAVGFENDFYGEEVGAYVQREEGSTVTSDDIIAFCRKELPWSKCPKVVVFGDSFPVTSTGKYQRNKLKPLYAQWKSTQFRERKSA